MDPSKDYVYKIDCEFSNDTWGGANAYLQFKSSLAASRSTIEVRYNGTTGKEIIYVNNS